MSTLIGLVMLVVGAYLAFQLIVWLWRQVIVPTGKFVWKMMFIAGVCIGFAIFFLSKDVGMNALPRELQIIIVAGVGLYAGWNHLKAKGKV